MKGNAARSRPGGSRIASIGDANSKRDASASLVHVINHEVVKTRSLSPLSHSPRPFLRWAGSKRLVLPQIIPYLPRTYGTYYEPFLGAGSMFFMLQPTKAVVSDMCAPLIETYSAIRDDATSVLRFMTPMRISKRNYYKVRAQKSAGRFKKAARFVYLNYACWNGLYRVNSAGEFNVPYGMPRSKNLADSDNIKACSSTLRASGVSIMCSDFEESVEDARAGDLVYFDPPYVTKHNSNGFRDYNERLFSWEDQGRLARLAARLLARRVHVLVSNALHVDIEKLYPEFSPISVTRKSTLAGAKKFRGTVEECVFVPRAWLRGRGAP